MRRPRNRSAFLFLLLAVSVILVPDVEARRRAVSPPATVTNPAYTEGGYASAVSVRQGGTISLHLANKLKPFNVEIVNLAHPNTVLQTISNVTTPALDCTGLHETGCNWPATLTLDIPASWPSGFYAARFTTSLGRRYAPFTVTAANRGSASKTLLITATHTHQAYNIYGNKNLYPSNDPARAHRVSYERPYHASSGLGKFSNWESYFLDWMIEEGRTFEAATEVDLEDPTFLTNYDLVVFVGHSEYWTKTARDHLEAFSASGGHVAIFGGNTMWWQIRLEDENRTIVGYKDRNLDPENGRNDAVVTTRWSAAPVYRPENLITGSSFRHAEYVNRDQTSPIESRIGYTVVDPTSWVFNGANATVGQAFGKAIAGLEVDGAIYNCNMQGLADRVDGSDGTPLNFDILAIVRASRGHGTIGMYTNPAGGTVFNAGTQNWARGLESDTIVQTITRNVLNRLGTGERMPYEFVDGKGVRARDLFNCALDTTEAKLVPGWQGEFGDIAVTSNCAYEGPTGLEITGAPRVQMTRDLAPTFNTMSKVETRFYVNADQATITSTFALVTLNYRLNNVITRRARIEYDGVAKAVRLVQYDDNNNSVARTDFVPLGSGWKSIEMSWSSPGTISLSVNGATALTLTNPSSTQRVSEVLLAYPGQENAGKLCVDALAVGLEKLDAVAPLR
jgi:hypothetical protein